MVFLRLQKFLAYAGIASRRQAEEIIKAGRVKVNGTTLKELGTKVEIGKDSVSLDDQVVEIKNEYQYILLHKPKEVVTTLKDPQNRTIVTDLLKGIKTRVYPVGRLDYFTEGLLLLTNDGELAYRLTHPKYKVPKTYLVYVKGPLKKEAITQLEKGVELEDGPTQPAKVRVREQKETISSLEITIWEGRNRQVRRMCEKVGYPVVYLKRLSFGPLTLGSLEKGEYRPLTGVELKSLKKACQML